MVHFAKKKTLKYIRQKCKNSHNDRNIDNKMEFMQERSFSRLYIKNTLCIFLHLFKIIVHQKSSVTWTVRIFQSTRWTSYKSVCFTAYCQGTGINSSRKGDGYTTKTSMGNIFFLSTELTCTCEAISTISLPTTAIKSTIRVYTPGVNIAVVCVRVLTFVVICLKSRE